MTVTIPIDLIDSERKNKKLRLFLFHHLFSSFFIIFIFSFSKSEYPGTDRFHYLVLLLHPYFIQYPSPIVYCGLNQLLNNDLKSAKHHLKSDSNFHYFTRGKLDFMKYTSRTKRMSSLLLNVAHISGRSRKKMKLQNILRRNGFVITTFNSNLNNFLTPIRDYFRPIFPSTHYE